jgi:ABC-2 type transport system permease protein
VSRGDKSKTPEQPGLIGYSDRPLGPRAIGPINWRGLLTLYLKEVQKFLKSPIQTVLAPMTIALLFLTVFTLAFGNRYSPLEGVSYAEFLAPGLIIMSVLQTSFINTSSSLMISKIQGNIVDILMVPMTSAEIVTGYVLAGMTRGLLVAAAVLSVMAFFVDLQIAHPGIALFYLVGASMCLAFVGIITGLWATKFEHMAIVTNFVITPLAFLSGTFYSVSRLPEPWLSIARGDPIYYMIDGFRYGFLGRSSGDLAVGIAMIVVLNLIVGALGYFVFKIGWKIKN